MPRGAPRPLGLLRPRGPLRPFHLLLLLALPLGLAACHRGVPPPPPPAQRLPVAAVVTAYYPNSHADVIVSRLLQTDTLDGRGRVSPLTLAGLFTDQVPERDISRALAQQFGFPIHDTVAGALTGGGDRLAVGGVLLIAEHGQYPRSPTTSIQYPKRRLFTEIAQVFRQTGQSVPVYVDKHLADTWEDAKWLYDTARELHVPLMAGSSLPVLWRYPPADVPAGAAVKEIVALSYHTLDAYGFHALEIVQALAEQRRGGETGVRAVQCLSGPQVWQALDDGLVDRELFEQALACVNARQGGRRPLRQAVREPTLMRLEYADGLRASVLTLNGVFAEWTAAWRYADGKTAATRFHTQEARPYMHFTYLLNGIEQMMQTGRPAWPVERTLLTSGALDALLQSRVQGGARLLTPQLEFAYTSTWRWHQPPPPPPDQPRK